MTAAELMQRYSGASNRLLDHLIELHFGESEDCAVQQLESFERFVALAVPRPDANPSEPDTDPSPAPKDNE